MQERLLRLRGCLFRSDRAEEVSWRQGADVRPVPAIRYTSEAEAGFGARTMRRLGFEVQPGDLPLRPSKRDMVETADGRQLRITEIEDTDAGTFLCWMEQA